MKRAVSDAIRDERLKSPAGSSHPSPRSTSRRERGHGESPTPVGSLDPRGVPFLQQYEGVTQGAAPLFEGAHRLLCKEQLVLDEISREASGPTTREPPSFQYQVQDNSLASNNNQGDAAAIQGLGELLVLEGLLEAELAGRAADRPGDVGS